MAITLLTFALASFGFVQAPKAEAPKTEAPKAEMKLEDYMERALANNADVVLAEAQVRLAEAELLKARQAAITKTTAIYYDLQVAKHVRDFAQLDLAKLNGLKKESYSKPEFIKIQMDYELAQNSVMKLTAQLEGPKSEASVKRRSRATSEDQPEPPPSKSFIAENAKLSNLSEAQMRFLKMLDLEVNIQSKDLTFTPDGLMDLHNLFNGVINEQLAKKMDSKNELPNWNALNKKSVNPLWGKMPLGALLEYIQDYSGQFFALKEYGFLYTPPRDNMVAQQMQDNLYYSISAVKLWKQMKSTKEKSETSSPKKLP